MKTLVKIFLLILIPMIGAFILSYPGVWKYRIENVLNKKILEESGWELSIGELSGHILKEINSKDVEIINKNGTRIYIPELSTQFNLLNSLAGKIHLKELNIYDFYFTQPSSSDKNRVFVLPDLAYNKFPLEIDNLTFNGTLSADFPDTDHIIKLRIKSTINSGESGLNINIDSLYIKHNEIDYAFRLNNTKANINNRIINLDPFNGSAADVSISGRLTFIQDVKRRLNGVLNINNIVIPEKLFEHTPIDLKFSKINSGIEFDTDFKDYSGLINLTNELGLKMTGDFNISKSDDNWLAQQILLQSNDATLSINGDYTDGEFINADFNLTGLNLSKWLSQKPETNISGKAELLSRIKDGYLQSLTVELKTEESKLFKEDTIKVDGSFVYENNVLNFSEPFTLKLGKSSIISEGTINFDKKELNLNLELDDADVFIINNFWSDSLASGTFTGDVNIYGDFAKPNFKGNIIGENINYDDLYLSSVKVSGQRQYAENYLGSTSIITKNGSWKNIKFETANINADLFKNETHITDITIINGAESLNGSARFDNLHTIYIEHLETYYKDHHFKNNIPFSVKIDNNGVDVGKFSANLDNGKIDGELFYQDRLNGYLKLSGITAEFLHPIINNPNYRFTGLMSGETNFQDIEQKQNFDIDMRIVDGGFTDKPFETMIAKMAYRDELLTIDKLSIIENTISNVNIIGKIPFGDRKSTDKIQLNFKLTETDYNTIAQFLPDWFDISATVNGEMVIDGYGNNMTTEIVGTIKKGKFERIDIGNGAFRCSYDGNNLNFKSLSSDLNDIHFTGYGYLPVDLNLYSDDFGKFRGNDSLYLFVEGKSSNLDFITNYFDEVDSAPGDYILALELSGIWDDIIRNGRISVKSATIHTPLLDDPIEEMHGFIHIDNNKLVIDNLSGKMHKKSRRRSNTKDNVSLSGDIDLNKFFDPYLNIRAKGKEAYFRSLIYEMEGLTDFDITVTGRDTILIAGEVAPIDIEMFMALTTSSLGVLPPEEGSTIIHYKIDFPIRGKFTLTNDQLDIVLIGDVSINQFGDKETNFAGELIIEEGKFYYYGDVFTIDEGFLTFDNRGFNPYLDISAHTTIDNERIDISIVGMLDNPVLTFSSESGFSQSDILELLTWRKRFEEQEFSSTGIGYQASDRILSWFGGQLDKNILQMSGLDRLGILEKVDVRGTSGLITAEEDFSISAPLTENVAINYAYRRSFGLTDSYHALGVELRLSRNLSIVGNIDRSGYMHVKYRLRYAY